MLLIHKEIPHMPLTELENDSESVCAKVFANKTSHYIAIWYREPSGSCEDFQLLRNQLEHIKTQHKKLPSVHLLGDFNFRDIVWPDRLSKNGTMLSQSKGQVLVDIMNDHGLEQLVNFPTQEENTLDLILTSLPGQFQEVHSPDKLSDHDMVAGTLKVFSPPRRKVYLYQKGDFDSMRQDSSNFEAVLTNTHNLYFFSRNKKNDVYPCKHKVYYIKMGFKGFKLYRHVFVIRLICLLF